jgi:hypothetical protein
MHYRFSVQAGAHIGEQVADYVAANYFRPIDDDDHDVDDDNGHHDLSNNSKWGFISVDGVNAPPHIAVLDMETRTVHTRWPVPGRPHGVIFEPLPEDAE